MLDLLLRYYVLDWISCSVVTLEKLLAPARNVWYLVGFNQLKFIGKPVKSALTPNLSFISLEIPY